MAGYTSFLGRVLFALVFLGSGVQKLQTFDLKSGGPVLDVMSPKLDEIFGQLHKQTGYSLPVQKVASLHQHWQSSGQNAVCVCGA